MLYSAGKQKFYSAKKKLEYGLVQDVATPLRLITTIQFTWNDTLVKGTAKVTAENTLILTLLFQVSCTCTISQIEIATS